MNDHDEPGIGFPPPPPDCAHPHDRRVTLRQEGHEWEVCGRCKAVTSKAIPPPPDRTPAGIVDRTTELDLELELASRVNGPAPTLDDLATALEVDRAMILEAARLCGARAVGAVLVTADAMLLLHSSTVRHRDHSATASAVRRTELGTVALILAAMAGEH